MSLKRALRTLCACIALCVAAALVSCGERRSPEEKSQTLVFGFSENFKTFDPAKQIYAQESAIIQQVLEPLVRWSHDLQLEPWLATHWETPDDCTTWIFYLREGVVFHDGTPFNAEAVKAHFDRILDPVTNSSRRTLIADVVEIEARDEYTVVFHMKAPNCILPERLTSTFATIESPTAMQKDEKEFARNPVGTGPFQFVSWDQAKGHIKLKKFDKHWNADAYHIPNLEFKQVVENTTRFILLEQGILDMADVSYSQVNVAKKSEDISLQSVPQLSIRYIGFNTQKPPFDDVRVRRAANYAINKDDMIKYVFFGVGEPAVGPLPSVLPAYNHNLTKYEYNPEKARQLLAEAGYPNGLKVRMWTMQKGTYNATSEGAIGYLTEVGFDINLEIYDNAVYWDRFDEFLTPSREMFPRKEGVYDIYVAGWVGGETAHGFLEPLFATGSYSNPSFYSNPEVDKLLAAYKTTADPAKRDEMYREMQRLIVDDAPWIFAFHGQINTGVRKHVKGYRANSAGMYYFENVRLEVDGEEKLAEASQ